MQSAPEPMPDDGPAAAAESDDGPAAAAESDGGSAAAAAGETDGGSEPAPVVKVRSRRTLVVRYVALVVVLTALVVGIASQREAVARDLSELGVAPFLLCLAAVLAGLYCSARSWTSMLSALGEQLPVPVARRIFFVGQLGKYLPGAVWPVLTQMRLARDVGASATRVGAATVAWMGMQVTTALTLAALALPLSSPGALGRYAWLYPVLPVGLVLLVPKVLDRALNTLLRLARRKPLPQPLRGSDVLRSIAWAAVMWALYATHLAVLAGPLGADTDRLPLLALGAFCLAWAAGPFAVIAPAGVGVREAVIVVVFSQALTTSAATAVALLSRVAMAVGDVAWAATATWVQRRNESQPSATTTADAPVATAPAPAAD